MTHDFSITLVGDGEYHCGKWKWCPSQSGEKSLPGGSCLGGFSAVIGFTEAGARTKTLLGVAPVSHPHLSCMPEVVLSSSGPEAGPVCRHFAQLVQSVSLSHPASLVCVPGCALAGTVQAHGVCHGPRQLGPHDCYGEKMLELGD